MSLTEGPTSDDPNIVTAMFLADTSPVMVNGGIFNIVSQPASNGLETSLKMLKKNTSLNSTHEFGKFTRCHPNTRQSIVLKLAEWSQNADGAHLVWVFGPEGIGKTSIAFSFTNFLHTERRVVASYFIQQSDELLSERYLIPTIAFQLAKYIPNLLVFILSSIDNHPTIFEQSMEAQLWELVVEPILASKIDFEGTVIIDGLEKMHSQESVAHLVDNFPAATSALAGKLKLVLFGRPEFAVKEAFDLPALQAVSALIDLKNEVNDPEDIRIFIQDKLQPLSIKLQHTMGGRSWIEDIPKLVDIMMSLKLLQSFSAAHRIVHIFEKLLTLQAFLHTALADIQLCAALVQRRRTSCFCFLLLLLFVAHSCVFTEMSADMSADISKEMSADVSAKMPAEMSAEVSAETSAEISTAFSTCLYSYTRESAVAFSITAAQKGVKFKRS